ARIEEGMTEENREKSLDELEQLLETAGGVCFARLSQTRPHPDVRTYLGSGKAEELSQLIKGNKITLIVVDDELSPSQIKNLEDAMETEVRVIDRTMLILDIFARNAVTSEGILQVEIAQLKYSMPRLLGKGTALSRLGGGIGTRGPGE
ncbi:MAG TPA: GTPase HflX, partial [Clostridiales bacterium]|nr:GTPase HflX [Clostridiales bacterium]